MNTADDRFPNQTANPKLSWLSTKSIYLGYALSIAASFTFFRTSIFITLALFSVGILLVYLPAPRRQSSRITLREQMAVLIGSGAVFAILAFIPDQRIRAFPLSPFGYIPAWVLLFHAFRDFRQIRNA